MIEYRSDPIPLTVSRDGRPNPAEARWVRSRTSPGGPALFDMVVTGPFGELGASGSDLFEALQRIRREAEADGWRFLVEGARPTSRALGIHRDQGEGLVVIRFDERSRTARHGLFDPITFDESGTVDEQDAAFERVRWQTRSQARGDGWRILNPPTTFLPPMLKLPSRIVRMADDPDLARWGWGGFRFGSRSGDGVLAIAPAGTSLDAAAAALIDTFPLVETPPIVLAIDGSIPRPLRAALNQEGPS